MDRIRLVAQLFIVTAVLAACTARAAVIAPTPVETSFDSASPSASPSPSTVGVRGGLPPATGAVPAGFVRYGGVVVDATTGAPIAGACVYAGPPAGCPPLGTPRTDASGYWAIDYPAGITFLWNFEHPDYEGVTQHAVQGTGEMVGLRHR